MVFPFIIEFKKQLNLNNPEDFDAAIVLEDIGKLIEKHKGQNIQIKDNTLTFRISFSTFNDEDYIGYFRGIEKGIITLNQSQLNTKFSMLRLFLNQFFLGVLVYISFLFLQSNSHTQYFLTSTQYKYILILLIISFVWTWIQNLLRLRKLLNKLAAKIESNELWFPKYTDK